MRKYLYIFGVFLFILNFVYFCNITPAIADTPTYFRINNDSVYLYRTPVADTENNNAYFKLPNTYFVKFNSTFDENFLNVTYRDFTGYVLKSDVVAVYSIPEIPFETNRIFNIQGVANLVIRSAPNTQSEYLGTIPFNATDITYFGEIEGEQANLGLSNIWYFCRYKSFEQGIITGYIYAPLTTGLTEFVPNTEEVLTEPTQNANSNSVLAPELKTGSNLILILCLTVPAILLLILVFRPEKRKKKREATRAITNLNRLSLPDKNDKNTFDF